VSTEIYCRFTINRLSYHTTGWLLLDSQMLLFWPPLLSGGYDVWGGTHATNPLKTKRIYTTFTSYVTKDTWDNVLCSIGKETFFFTDSARQNGCFVLLKTPRATQWRADSHGKLTNDRHVMSLSSCERRSNSLNLCKGVTVVIFVVGSDCRSEW